MLKIVKEYLDNKKKLEKVSTEQDKFHKTIRNKQEVQRQIYWKTEAGLQRTRDENMRQLEIVKESYDEGKKKERTELVEIIERVNRYIQYLKLYDKYGKVPNLTIDMTKITHYDNRKDFYLEWLEKPLYQDEYLNIRLVIYQNDKPVNKYSLSAYGKTIFTSDDLLPSLKDYGSGLCDYQAGCAIVYGIKVFPTINALKHWLDIHRESILEDYGNKYLEVKKEYQEVIKSYTLDDFKDIIKLDKNQ